MQNLRDQLLKAGLANKQQKQQIETEKRRARKRQKKGKAEESAQEQQRLVHEARLEAQRTADRERAAAQRAAIDTREKLLRLQNIIDYWQLDEDDRADRPWYFTTRHNTINHVYVSKPTANRLTAGDVAIVEHPQREDMRYVLVEHDAAAHIDPIDPDLVRFSNRLRQHSQPVLDVSELPED
jgi:uncharacterized protein YaiL (DUF2058 family)